MLPCHYQQQNYYNAIKGECQMKKDKHKNSYANTSVSGYSDEYKKVYFSWYRKLSKKEKRSISEVNKIVKK